MRFYSYVESNKTKPKDQTKPNTQTALPVTRGEGLWGEGNG